MATSHGFFYAFFQANFRYIYQNQFCLKNQQYSFLGFRFLIS
jgi:hypothetical protein